MRLALALVALVVASPAGAACIARAHKGAIPYYDEGSATEAPKPADTSHGAPVIGPNDAEVAGIDRDTRGQLWVYRVHEFAWKREDIDLRGNCRRQLREAGVKP